MTRLLAAAALALGLAVTAAPAPAQACPENCISICWDCIDGPYVGCYYVNDFVVDRICL